MFKKIYFNFALMCTLTTVIIMILTLTILTVGRMYFYYNNMEKDILSCTESNMISSISNILNYNRRDEDKTEDIDKTISNYKGKLGIDENRSLYIINSSDMKIVYPQSHIGEYIEETENIKIAAHNSVGSKYHISDDYFDFAYPFDCREFGSCILYIRDNKSELRADIFNQTKTVGLAFIPAIILSLLTALLLKKSVTVPMKKITTRAEGLEQGELYENFEDIKYDEFKELIRAINNMGFVMAGSVRQMNSDKHRVEVIIEHINNGIITFDTNKKPIQINSAAKKILKISGDGSDINFDEFFKELGTDIRMAEFLYLEKSKTIEKEINKDGEHIRVCCIPFKLDNERNAGVVCVFEDITKQFNVMEAMRKFVADVSHELKTPITVISSYTETVLNSYLDDKAMTSNLLNIVYQEAGKMTELVQNLLDISKYEMKAIPRRREPFSIDDMLSALVKTFELEAEKKELDLKYARMNDIPMFIGSRGDMERAVKNIISNSIKYTSRGDKIRIYAGRMNNDIYIKVEDTGWGIPESKLGHLFERFYRVEDEARSRDKGGTGLGLSIAKEIIENHSGNIRIESEYTKYTRVTITLPVSDKKN